MIKNEREILEQALLEIANRYSITRFKISTINFDLDYQRNDDGNLYLISEKAIIRVLGKVTKVPIGENEEFSTYEAAFEATKLYWSEYYKKVRASRSDKERVAEAKRQKRYREKRKAEAEEFRHRK